MGDAIDLVEVQVGTESTWGDGATATARLMGVEDITLSPTVEAILIEELRGSLSRASRAELTKVEGAASMSGILQYEDGGYLFDSLFSQATPGGAGPYTYTYNGPLGTAPTPRSLALYKGYGSVAKKLRGGLVNELTLSWETGQPVKYAAEFIGLDVVDATLAALSDRSTNNVMGPGTQLFIDTFATAAGTTEITGLAFLMAELKINANRTLQPSLFQLGPQGYTPRKYSASLRLHLELDSTRETWLNSILAASSVFQRVVRLQNDGASNLDLTVDFAGTTLEAPEPLTEEDGLVTLDFTLEDTEEATLGNWIEAIFTSDLASLP